MTRPSTPRAGYVAWDRDGMAWESFWTMRGALLWLRKHAPENHPAIAEMTRLYRQVRLSAVGW